MITKDLTQKDIGRWVLFEDPDCQKEKGKIKCFDNKAQVAWVVYKCNEEWDRWKEYTAQATHYKDLKFV